MKYTLLELTQAVLSSMDSDEINSINDSVESRQVVEIIKTVYDGIVSQGDAVKNKTLFNLDASSDVTKPVLMTKPEDIERIEWIKYNVETVDDEAPVWDLMTYLPLIDFIAYMHSYNQDEDNIETFEHTVDGFTTTIAYRNDVGPKYFTTFNDDTILFDAYNNEVDSTLQTSKTMCYGLKVTDFVRSDTFTPELQPQQFSLLLNEAKSLAWAELKQTQHQKAEQGARRGWRRLQKSRQEISNNSNMTDNNNMFSRLPDFSRNR